MKYRARYFSSHCILAPYLETHFILKIYHLYEEYESDYPTFIMFVSGMGGDGDVSIFCRNLRRMRTTSAQNW